MQTSMQYTIGTALSRAHDEGARVDVLVDGHWLAGRIVGADGIGVVLEDEAEHCVVRLEKIAAVRVRQVSSTHAPDDLDTDARPMPGPRQAGLVTNVA